MTNRNPLPKIVSECVPKRILNRVCELCEGGRIWASEITELRLRVDRPASVTHMGKSICLDEVMNSDEMSECAARLCRGSVYAHEDTVREGYISVEGGIRAGICGTLAPDGRGVREFTSINIRIPHIIRNICTPMLDRCIPCGIPRSLLIFSPPGCGKTTLLRDLASTLGRAPYLLRVALIDTRQELYIREMFADTICDILLGYPKATGIEIAVRTLSPDVIICDELGAEAEARAILQIHSSGVPIIASAHGASAEELMRRPCIRLLHDSRVFDGYMGISRRCEGGRLTKDFDFSFTPAEEVS